jgi:chromate reductase, NAD(P)H dehydrogenase (quinone)
MKITAISGSLRKDSYNTLLLEVLRDLGAKQGVTITVHDLNNVPFFSEDVESKKIPEPVMELAKQVKASDALLISTPEYNGITSGAVVNILEWLSRDSVGTPLVRKPVGIVGATTGSFGTNSAQEFLKSLALHLDMIPMNRPKIRISHAEVVFSEDGTIADSVTRDKLTEFIESLKSWSSQFASK